jgi:hypothetical protein
MRLIVARLAAPAENELEERTFCGPVYVLNDKWVGYHVTCQTLRKGDEVL